MTISYLRYVSRERIWAYALLGWRFTSAPHETRARNHHRDWSTVMKWNRPGEPKEPQK